VADTRLNLKLSRTPARTDLHIQNLLNDQNPLIVQLSISLAPGTRVETVTLDGQPSPFNRTPAGIELKLNAASGHHVGITHSGGISILPLVHHPVPGDSSTGLKIISDRVEGGKYIVKVEGLSGSPGKIRLMKSGRVLEHEFIFPGSKEKYVQADLEFLF
jgi:hypothetical protein